MSLNLPYSHAWNTVVILELRLLVLKKLTYRTVGLWLAVSFWPLAHCQNVASLSFFIGITLVDVHLNWLNWFHFLVLRGGLLAIPIDCMLFLSPFLDVTRMSTSTVSFLSQLEFWNSLPKEPFPLTYDLNGLKSRINRHFSL